MFVRIVNSFLSNVTTRLYKGEYKMIEIQSVSKSFGSFKAVDNISFKIKDKEILGLLGPNGAGKSTTINMMCGVLKKDSGKINILGHDLDKDWKYIRREMGVVPQDIAVFYDLTTIENLMYFGSLYGLKGNELKSKVKETLEFIGLENVANKIPKNFSGGMKRRLNIGCAIVHQPKLIILDEPTVGIDAQSRNHILKAIKELNRRGSTIIYTSHYMEEIQYLCDNIVIIDHGKVIEQGKKDELLNKYNKLERFEFTVDRTVNDNLIKSIESIDGLKDCTGKGNTLCISAEKDSRVLEKIISKNIEMDIGFSSINMKQKNLEDIFLELTGRELRD